MNDFRAQVLAVQRKRPTFLWAAAIIILALLGLVFATSFASATPPEILKIDVCHATASESNPYVLINVNINSVEDAQHVGGHGNHEGDAWDPYTYEGIEYPGQGDMSNCDGAPTEEPPTPTPTDIPPSPTPTDVPPTDVPPTDEPSETPTNEPTLPSTGPSDGNVEYELDAWLIGEFTWAGHAGVEGSEFDELWSWWLGTTHEFRGETYTVVNRQLVEPTEVWVIDAEGDWTMIFLTCSNYDGTTWTKRLVLFLAEGG